MKRKPTIATAGNTLAPALAAIKSCGYTVATDDDTGLLRAENEAERFLAEDPVALLGLIRMREIRGDDWKATDDEIDAFLDLN